MKWMRERDLLIAQTMAFVQSVTGKKPEAEKAVAASTTFFAVETSGGETSGVETSGNAVTTPPMPDIEALLAEAITTGPPRDASRETPRPVQIARNDLRSDFQSEIKARVANFRANQERFNREREAYCSATMAKVHAALRDGTGPVRPEK